MSFYRPHDRYYSPHGDRSMTRQEFKDECDIYTILQQFQQTGVMRHVQQAQPLWGELPDNIDFQQSLETVAQAQAAFASLPSKVREHFNHEPAQFLAAMYDSSREPELRALGLLQTPQGSPPTSSPSEGTP